MQNKLHRNNFDLIRILAAFQVLVLHAKLHLKIDNSILNFIELNFLSCFPGVPIFFFISGYLIYGSYERNKNNLVKFSVNRLLRIYPALWICFVLTFFLLALDFNGNLLLNSPKQLFFWMIGQLTLFQFYTPDILRFWGVGVPNGSLWTISVEMQFYILIPIVYFIVSKFKSKSFIFGLMLLISIVANYLIGQYTNNYDNLFSKLGSVFIGPYFYYFLIGIVIKKYWEKLAKFFEGQFLKWFISYCLFILVFNCYLGLNIISYFMVSPLNLIADFMLAGVTFSLAYSYIGIGSKYINGYDISYGLYIYHMLVVNYLVHRGMFGKEIYLAIAILATVILATASWILIEKRALKSKDRIASVINALFYNKAVT